MSLKSKILREEEWSRETQVRQTEQYSVWQEVRGPGQEKDRVELRK